VVGIFFVVLWMVEIDWVTVVLDFNDDETFDDIGKEEVCEVIALSDTVFNDVDTELTSVECVVTFAAKIKEKWFVTMVISHYIHYNCYSTIHILVRDNIAKMLA
jgi:hypothetical protein